MNTYTIQLTFIVQTDHPEYARELGICAFEHLRDTFNDHDTLAPNCRVEVLP